MIRNHGCFANFILWCSPRKNFRLLEELNGVDLLFFSFLGILLCLSFRWFFKFWLFFCFVMMGWFLMRRSPTVSLCLISISFSVRNLCLLLNAPNPYLYAKIQSFIHHSLRCYLLPLSYQCVTVYLCKIQILRCDSPLTSVNWLLLKFLFSFPSTMVRSSCQYSLCAFSVSCFLLMIF